MEDHAHIIYHHDIIIQSEHLEIKRRCLLALIVLFGFQPLWNRKEPGLRTPAVARAALQLNLAKLGFGADFWASSCHFSSSSSVHP